LCPQRRAARSPPPSASNASPALIPPGNLPLIVLTRGLRTDEHIRRQHDDIAALSSVGKVIVAPDSDHEIHLYRPDLVIQAIREVRAAVLQRQAKVKK
jgi:hypothetical protein